MTTKLKKPIKKLVKKKLVRKTVKKVTRKTETKKIAKKSDTKKIGGKVTVKKVLGTAALTAAALAALGTGFVMYNKRLNKNIPVIKVYDNENGAGVTPAPGTGTGTSAASQPLQMFDIFKESPGQQEKNKDAIAKLKGEFNKLRLAQGPETETPKELYQRYLKLREKRCEYAFNERKQKCLDDDLIRNRINQNVIIEALKELGISI